MKKLAKILLLVLVLTLAISCLVACGEQPCAHEYGDDYTCHDRTCILCGESLQASTEHEHINGVCMCGDIDGAYYTDGLEFKLLEDGSAYAVVGYIGDETRLVLPSEYDGMSVTLIGEEAFMFCNKVEEIVISESITSLSSTCFEPCMSLEKIEVNSDNDMYKDVDGSIYDKEGKKLIHYPRGKKEKNIDVLETVTHIDKYAFAWNTNLEVVRIPNGCIEIGERAFYMCTSLRSVDIKENSNLQMIGKETFYNCWGLTTLFIPESVENLSDYTFTGSYDYFTIYCEAENKPDSWGESWNDSNRPVVWDCKNNSVANNGCIYIVVDGITYSIKDGYAHAEISRAIVNANVQSSITHNGNEYTVTSVSCPAYTYYLESVYIPDSIEQVNCNVHYNDVFYVLYCEKESKPDDWDNEDWGNRPIVWNCANNDVADDGIIYVNKDDIVYGIKDGVTEVVEVKHGIIEANIRSEIDYKGVAYPVTAIKGTAFNSQTSLSKVTIPKSITTIGCGDFEGAFDDCKRAIIYCEATSQPDGWNSGWNSSNCPVVWDCKNNDVATDGYVYVVEDGIKYGIKDGFATVVKQAQDIAVANIRKTVHHKGVKYDVTVIAEMAFSETMIENVSIPKSIVEIGEGAFGAVPMLKNIKVASINTAYKSIDGNLYTKEGNILLKYATGKNDEIFNVPCGVEEIEDYAFFYCLPIKQIIIPNTVTIVGNWTFSYCDSLTIYCEAESQPSGWDSYWNYSNCPVYWYSETEPTGTGNYWRYVNGVPTKW